MAPRRSASTSPQPRRYHRPTLPNSLDLGESNDNNTYNNVSPDMANSEYHTVCEESKTYKMSSFKHPSSVESRDSKLSTETATLHTAEVNISDDGCTASEIQTETVSSHTENDLTEDATPTFNDDDLVNSINEENDPSTVIDIPQDEKA